MQSQHAETVSAKLLVLVTELVDADVLHRRELAIVLEVCATREDRLGSALADDPVLSLGGANDHRHDPPFKVERDLINLGVVRDVRMVVRGF
jgi:hypothetical protein